MNNAKKILLVEDDQDIATLLRLNLQDEGYQIVHEADGARALQQLEQCVWDAVILDLMLPGVDGLEICRRIRQMTRYLPVIIISARTSETHRVLGLETGLTITCRNRFQCWSWLPVSKRCFVVRRRWAKYPSGKRGDCQPWSDYRSALPRGTTAWESIELTPREFDLLYWFARHPGEVFSRLSLLENVWGYQHEGYEHTVNTHINRLRIKIEKDPAEPEIILTVWGKGYKFATDKPESAP